MFMQQEFYIDPVNGEDLWDGRSSVPQADGSDGPFRSFPGMLEALEKLSRTGQVDEATVYIKGGQYELPEPLLFRAKDSGRIVLRPYPGEKVGFSGGRRLKGFETVTLPNGQSVWRLHIPQIQAGMWESRALYVNGQFRPRSRFPKQGTLRITSTPAGLDSTALYDNTRVFGIAPEDVAAAGDLVGCDIVVVHYWVDEHFPVIAYENGTVFSDRNSIFNLRDDFENAYARYWLENAVDALSEPGEWAIHKKSGYLYYIPLPGETPENTTIELPVLNRLVELCGTSHVRFEDIAFHCTNWEYAPPAPIENALPSLNGKLYAASPQAASFSHSAIDLTDAAYVTFRNCEFYNLGNNALRIGHGCHHCRVENSHFHDCGMSGIRIEGSDSYQSEGKKTYANAVSRCRLHDLTKVFYSGVGIFIKDSSGNHIEKNEISYLEYTGISCGWVWGYNESETHHNIIENNHIHHLGSGLMSDMGGIYMLGAQPGSIIRNNLIHDVRKANYGGWGIYLDEGSSYIVVEGNTVYNTDCEAFFQHYGMENIVRNNHFTADKDGVIGIGRIKNGCVALNLFHNVLRAKDVPVYQIGQYKKLQAKLLVADANDIQWTQAGVFAKERQGTEEISIAQWHSYGLDTHSLIQPLQDTPPKTDTPTITPKGAQ